MRRRRLQTHRCFYTRGESSAEHKGATARGWLDDPRRRGGGGLCWAGSEATFRPDLTPRPSWRRGGSQLGGLKKTRHRQEIARVYIQLNEWSQRLWQWQHQKNICWAAKGLAAFVTTKKWICLMFKKKKQKVSFGDERQVWKTSACEKKTRRVLSENESGRFFIVANSKEQGAILQNREDYLAHYLYFTLLLKNVFVINL